MLQKPIVRFRTVNALVREIKTQDPDSCICASFIRKLIKEDLIDYRKSNTRVYVNVDSLWAYMSGGSLDAEPLPF